MACGVCGSPGGGECVVVNSFPAWSTWAVVTYHRKSTVRKVQHKGVCEHAVYFLRASTSLEAVFGQLDYQGDPEIQTTHP